VLSSEAIVFGRIAQSWITTDNNGIAECRRCTKTHGRSDSRLDQSRARSANHYHVSLREPFAFKKLNSVHGENAALQIENAKIWRATDAFTTQRAAIWTACKKINASGFVVPTTFGAECRLPLTFWPKLPHPAARFVCDNSLTCLVCNRRQQLNVRHKDGSTMTALGRTLSRWF